MKKIFAVVLVAVMAMALATTAFAVNEVESISGDLTVTGFFAEKTEAVALKDGDTVTLKFHNKTNGTANFENYVLAVIGEIGDAYAGWDQEIAILRADNYGWNGGYGEFAEWPWETDINWDNWVAAMQAGVDVELTVTKNGNTIAYAAQIGEYYDNITLTSTKDLPETIYVFLTGENCTLTGITSTVTSANTDDGSDDQDGDNEAGKTGFATIALAVAAIGSGAYVVSKKRH